MRRIIGWAAATVAVGLCFSGQAIAADTYTLCSTGPGKPVVSPSASGRCAAGEPTIELATPHAVNVLKRQVRQLRATLAGVNRNGNTLKFSGMNLQIVSGSGSTGGPVNGLGNVIIGYNEVPGAQSGSHNLILGDHQSFTSFGGIITGRFNTLSGPFAAVLGGDFNDAAGRNSAVLGGANNDALADGSSVTGGVNNTANGSASSVSGGQHNTASGVYSSVTGGFSNLAIGNSSVVLGGDHNTAQGNFSTERGGTHQTVSSNEGYAP